MIDYYLRQGNDPCLRIKCRPVDDFSSLGSLLDSMDSIMSDFPYSRGIAAPQVGDDRRVFIAKINVWKREVFVNPKITKSRGYLPFLEECLSFPGKVKFTMRRYSLDLTYQDVFGNPKDGRFNFINSVVLQHEIDHLNGKLLFN